MRVLIRATALHHGITPDEIRAVIEFPALRIRLAARREGERLKLFVGPPTARQPWIEVIGDFTDEALVVFHGMMLRPTVLRSHESDHLVIAEYGPQRKETRWNG